MTTSTNGESIRLRCPEGHILNGQVSMGTTVRCPKCLANKRPAEFEVTEQLIVQALKKRRQPKPAVAKRIQASERQAALASANEHWKTLHPDSLDHVLFHLGADDPVDRRAITQHVMVTGRTGSGKTSTVGRLLLLSLMKKPGIDGPGPQAGGFLFCFKSSDREMYRQLVAEAGRLSDLVEIDLDSGHVLNFLEREKEAIGQDAAMSCVEMFAALSRLADRNRKDSGGDSYWRFATRTLILRACETLILAQLPLNLPSLSRVVTSIPHEEELYAEDALSRSFLLQVMDRIEERLQASDLSKSEQLDYEQLQHYWFEEMNRLPLRTKGGVIGGFTSVAASFTSGRFRNLFNGEHNTIRPSDAWTKRTLFLIDLNQETLQETGRLGGSIIRRQFCREIQRRTIKDLETDPLIFMCLDEYARFCDPEFDEQLLATVREKKCACIHLYQSQDQLIEAAGSKEKANSLCQNMLLKFMLANDGATADWNSSLLGKTWSMLEYSGVPLGQAGGGHGGGSRAQVEHLLPEAWHKLKTGGTRDGNLVGCICFQGGKPFSDGRPYRFVEFRQASKQEKGS